MSMHIRQKTFTHVEPSEDRVNENDGRGTGHNLNQLSNRNANDTISIKNARDLSPCRGGCNSNGFTNNQGIDKMNDLCTLAYTNKKKATSRTPILKTSPENNAAIDADIRRKYETKMNIALQSSFQQQKLWSLKRSHRFTCVRQKDIDNSLDTETFPKPIETPKTRTRTNLMKNTFTDISDKSDDCLNKTESKVVKKNSSQLRISSLHNLNSSKFQEFQTRNDAWRDNESVKLPTVDRDTDTFSQRTSRFWNTTEQKVSNTWTDHTRDKTNKLYYIKRRIPCLDGELNSKGNSKRMPSLDGEMYSEVHSQTTSSLDGEMYSKGHSKTIPSLDGEMYSKEHSKTIPSLDGEMFSERIQKAWVMFNERPNSTQIRNPRSQQFLVKHQNNRSESEFVNLRRTTQEATASHVVHGSASTYVNMCNRNGDNRTHIEGALKKKSSHHKNVKKFINHRRSLKLDQRSFPASAKRNENLSENNSESECTDNLSRDFQQNCKMTPFSRWYCIFYLIICFSWTLSGDVIRAERSGEYVHIDPVQTPIYFSTNVILTCNITKTAKPGNLVWYKLPSLEPLAVNEFSRNLSKYDVEKYYSQTGTIYQLTIKNFDLSDVDCIYRCDAGFYSNTKYLHLNEEEYIVLPTDDNIQTIGIINEYLLNVKVLIRQVYPAPVCSVMFQEQNLTNKLKVKNEAGSIFFKTSLTLENITGNCMGEVKFVCYIGMDKKLISVTFGECNLSHDFPIERTTTYDFPTQRTTTYVVSSLLSIVCICLCVGAACLYKRRKQQPIKNREEIDIDSLLTNE